MKETENIVTVKNLKKHFHIKPQGMERKSAYLKAVDDVSFTIEKGEILGVVGESGCGKSTLGKTMMRLYEKTNGEVTIHGQDIFALNPQQLKEARNDVQMIFQDPYSSLNPRKKVSSLIGQPLRIHGMTDKKERDAKVVSLMEEVGLNPGHRHRFPHQFSGGQRQRIGIARALALDPDFVICDEAVSALDVSVQAQIINLLLDLQKKHGYTYMFISHDLGVVEFISTRILVMYLGRIVEIADKKELMENPQHPYTKTLIEAFPVTDPSVRHEKKKVVMGDVPSPINPPKGCHFHPRCPYAKDICREQYPPLKETGKGHSTACWLMDE